jgi:ATP-binding cassette, subfamily C (CFTR/MRP), member 1
MQQHTLSVTFPNSSSSDTAAHPPPLLSTGSFSGFRSTIQQLGYGYLSSVKQDGQPLCGNAEGWGPLSKERYDFTPCFMDVWVSTVAVYGILFGAVAVWWLVRRKTRAVVERDWCFWCKHVGLSSPSLSLPFLLAGTGNEW